MTTRDAPRKSNWVLVFLGIILACALVVRVWGIDFPRYHWDEGTNFDSVFYASYNNLALPTYVHGTFFQYGLLGIWYTFLLVQGLVPDTVILLDTYFHNPIPFLVLARLWVAIMSTANVLVVYVLGKRLYGTAVGLLSALFLAFEFLHVSESHYARGHVVATFFATLAVYFSARILSDARMRNYVLAGICIGLGTAMQYSVLLTVIPLVVAHWAKLHAERRHAPWREWVLNRSLLMGLDTAAVAFFIVTPYALINFPFYAGEMKWFLTQAVSHTWVSAEGQPVFLFYLTEHLKNGIGLGLEMIALVGVIYAMLRREPRDWVLLAFPIPLFITLAKGENFARYALLLLPFLSIWAARFLWWISEKLKARVSDLWRYVGLGLVALLCVIPSILNSVRWDYWLTQPDTRVLGTQWILANVPNDATMILEGADVLGPPVPTTLALLEQAIKNEPVNTVGHVYLQAIRKNQRKDIGYRAEMIFRLDERHISGIFQGKIENASYYTERGIDYLVTSEWMIRDSGDQYASAFRASLDTLYEPIKIFTPTVPFRFDPYAWRMDYDALAQIVPGQPGIGGPTLTVYRRRAGQ